MGVKRSRKGKKAWRRNISDELVLRVLFSQLAAELDSVQEQRSRSFWAAGCYGGLKCIVCIV